MVHVLGIVALLLGHYWSDISVVYIVFIFKVWEIPIPEYLYSQYTALETSVSLSSSLHGLFDVCFPSLFRW